MSESHINCPIYRAVDPRPLPLALTSPAFLLSKSKRVLTILAIPVVFASVVAAGFLWNLFGPQVNRLQTELIPLTGGDNNTANNTELFNLRLTPSATPFLPPTSMAPRQLMPPTCVKPDGWMTYVVNPTDSLVRLSVVYGASIEALQQANCMGNNTVILPGQVIFVPFVPTETPNTTLAMPVPTALQMVNTPLLLYTYTHKPTLTQRIAPSRTPETPTTTITPLPTNTPAPTNTPGPTNSPVPTNTSAPTSTPAPTNTPLPTITRAPTLTPAPTNTPLLTITRAPTLTPAPTNTPLLTITRAPSNTPAPTNTPLPTNTIAPSNTPLPPPTATNVPPPPPTATDVPPPPPTATEVPPPPPTATEVPPPPPTATEVPPPPPTATEVPPPPPTATEVPPAPPTATEVPPPPPPTAAPTEAPTAEPVLSTPTPAPAIVIFSSST